MDRMATGSRYAGKVVIVTGGGSGIGAAIVRAFVESGAQVVICDKEESGARALEQELPGTVFILSDVTREEDMKTLVSETIHRFGRLDCLVNNAGRFLPPQWPEETCAQEFRELMEVNLMGPYTLTMLALPYLRESRGNVINISSLVRTIACSRSLTYVATKGALTAMTKALALDESRHGVRVNCISPGNIWTPMWQGVAAVLPDPKATIREAILAQPLGRMGHPAEVAAAAVFLAAEASFCTGCDLFVTGGAELGYGVKAKKGASVEAPDTLPGKGFPHFHSGCSD